MTTFDKIVNLYEKELNIPNNETCLDCDAKYKNPLLPWHIGDKYFTDEGGILFAGKPHRGEQPDNSIKRKSHIIDARERANELYLTKSWPYWSYPKAILSKIYGSSSAGWDHIAFTNIIKCTSTYGIDKTSYKCAINCIDDNQVIFKEIKQLKPRKIVFFTWNLHREIFDTLPIAEYKTIIEHTNKNHKIKCGNKMLGWWDRSFKSIWGTKVDILIVGHPERMKKSDYTTLIYDWLLDENINKAMIKT